MNRRQVVILVCQILNISNGMKLLFYSDIFMDVLFCDILLFIIDSFFICVLIQLRLMAGVRENLQESMAATRMLSYNLCR